MAMITSERSTISFSRNVGEALAIASVHRRAAWNGHYKMGPSSGRLFQVPIAELEYPIEAVKNLLVVRDRDDSSVMLDRKLA
jgi:hypothetical protein